MSSIIYVKEICSQFLESSLGLLVFRENVFRTLFFNQNFLIEKENFRKIPQWEMPNL